MATEVKGPDAEQLKVLKAENGKLFKVKYSEDSLYIIRQIKRSEYKDLIGLLEGQEVKNRAELHDEKVCQMGVVWPVLEGNWAANSPAGLIPNLSTQIMDRSGFTNQVEVEEV
jgi:hypothetical protein